MKQQFKKLSCEKYYKAPNFEKCFKTRFCYFILLYKGDSDLETDIQEIFKIFTTSTNNSDDFDFIFSLDDDKKMSLLLIISEEIVNPLAVNLANRTMDHFLTSTISEELLDSFIDQINVYNVTTILCYMLAQFYRIMIDIGAAKHSIAGYGQFQAL